MRMGTAVKSESDVDNRQVKMSRTLRFCVVVRQVKDRVRDKPSLEDTEQATQLFCISMDCSIEYRL